MPADLDKISATRETRLVTIESFEPSAPLRPYVQIIRVIETAAENLAAPLPEPGLVLSVRYAGRATVVERGGAREVPVAALSGVYPALRRIHTSAHGGLVLAVFRSAGASQCFDVPLHELFRGMADLTDVTSRAESSRLQVRVAEAQTPAARAAVMDAYLCSRLTESATDRMVSAAAAAIRRTRGTLRIESLSAALGLSTDRLEKRFRRVVGASPKQLASIVRFRHTVRTYRPGLSLTQLAQDAGYFDQSHLAREFRTFTGRPPRDFLRSTDYWG